ncbi:MAG: sigma-70 family RNA polymerase sigma factor [Anaerolineales bacterium]|nr:sigma-70 family RNA polymerase sigma factor [Anaerolineales bacterium]
MSAGQAHGKVNMPEQLTLGGLLEACQAQRANYYRLSEVVDSRFCYELFRRAFAERDDAALTALYHLYLPQIAAWVRQLAGDTELDYPLGFYVADCASHFVLKMQARPFEAFPQLGQIMAFWKKCVFGLMTDSLRRRRFLYIPIEDLPLWAERQDASSGLEIAWLVDRINQLLASDNERLLIELALYQEMKPREIAAHYPQLWPSPGAVSTAIFRLKSRLKDDPAIQKLSQ